MAPQLKARKRKEPEDATQNSKTARNKKTKTSSDAASASFDGRKESQTKSRVTKANSQDSPPKESRKPRTVTSNVTPAPRASGQDDQDSQEPGVGEEPDSPQGDYEDDQTEALLRGFESSDEDEAEEGTRTTGKLLPQAIDSEVSIKLDRATKALTPRPGVIYVGRIPHGFYEHEMRGYFSQFGDISRLRLSRNRKTGRSKHYAFIEFASADVAQIVADTMNNYLMFGHILKCRLIPPEQVPAMLWKGANKRFKKIPWNKLEARRLEKPRTREAWEKKRDKEMQTREDKMKKLQDVMGYSLELKALKNVDDIPEQIDETLVPLTIVPLELRGTTDEGACAS